MFYYSPINNLSSTINLCINLIISVNIYYSVFFNWILLNFLVLRLVIKEYKHLSYGLQSFMSRYYFFELPLFMYCVSIFYKCVLAQNKHRESAVNGDHWRSLAVTGDHWRPLRRKHDVCTLMATLTRSWPPFCRRRSAVRTPFR